MHLLHVLVPGVHRLHRKNTIQKQVAPVKRRSAGSLINCAFRIVSYDYLYDPKCCGLLFPPVLGSMHRSSCSTVMMADRSSGLTDHRGTNRRANHTLNSHQDEHKQERTRVWLPDTKLCHSKRGFAASTCRPSRHLDAAQQVRCTWH